MSSFELPADAKYQHKTAPGQHGAAWGDSRSGNTLIAIHQEEYWTLKDGESDWVRQGSSEGKKLRFSSSCMTGDGILVTGGLSDKGGRSKQCWKLTLPTLDWTPVIDLHVARYKHVAVSVGEQVCVVGGRNTMLVQSMECIDDQNRSWNESCNMPFVLDGLTACSYKYLIYVFGGHASVFRSDTNMSKKTYAFDTTRDKWNKKADMPGACFRGTSVLHRDRIYVLGGRENCCMSYDPGQDQWKTHSTPGVKHIGTSAVVWKDRILLCGGENTSVIEEYNPDTDTWSEWKHQLPKAEADPGVFAIQM